MKFKTAGIKRMIAILLIVMLALLACACTAKNGGEEPATEPVAEQQENGGEEPTAESAAEQQEYIGIISAMDNEVSLLKTEAEIDHVDTYGGVDFSVGELAGKQVVIAKSGIGKVLSAAAMTSMLNNYNISKVIFTGIAGGVGDETQVLDEVIADRLVQHDYGTMTNDGFKWTAGNTGETVGDDGYFFCDEDLVKLAYDASVEVVGAEHTFKGTIVSGDQFISSEEYVEKLQNDFDALACEMEGAAIGSVCREFKKPYVVIRAMSDKADGKAHETYENMMNIAADNSSRIVIKMLETM